MEVQSFTDRFIIDLVSCHNHLTQKVAEVDLAVGGGLSTPALEWTAECLSFAAPTGNRHSGSSCQRPGLILGCIA
jgi:hypothetical protein